MSFSPLEFGDLNLWWDKVNHRLGIGTNAPADAFDLNGAMDLRGSSGVLLHTWDGVTERVRMTYEANNFIWRDIASGLDQWFWACEPSQLVTLFGGSANTTAGVFKLQNGTFQLQASGAIVGLSADAAGVLDIGNGTYEDKSGAICLGSVRWFNGTTEEIKADNEGGSLVFRNVVSGGDRWYLSFTAPETITLFGGANNSASALLNASNGRITAGGAPFGSGAGDMGASRASNQGAFYLGTDGNCYLFRSTASLSINAPASQETIFTFGGVGEAAIFSNGVGVFGNNGNAVSGDQLQSCAATNVAAASNIAQLALYDTTPVAAGVGGWMSFQGIYTAGGAVADFAAIGVQKHNNTSGDYNGDLCFWARQNGSGIFSATAPNMIILGSNGNVGIGTNSPSSLLSVGSSSQFQVNSSGKITEYDGIATIGNGVPAEYAKSDLTAQSAAITSTLLYAVPAAGAGMYRISWSAKVTQAATNSSVLGGTNGFQINYTDADDSVALTPLANPTASGAGNTTSTQISGVVVINAAASTNINYLFDYTSVGVTPMQYSLHIKLEKL